MAVEDWSATAGSNTAVGGVDIAEGMNPALVNNAIRAVMAELALFFQSPTFKSTDATDAVNPAILLDRDSASPANDDLLGYIRFRGRNSGAAAVVYAGILAQIVDRAASSEDGRLLIQTVVAGTSSTRGYVEKGFVIGAPSGLDKGTGTLNATGIYAEGRSIVPLVGSKTWDPGVVSPTSTATTTVTVTGARVNDQCLANLTTNTAVLPLTAQCFANDTVTVALYYGEGSSSVDYASGTLNVMVFKQA